MDLATRMELVEKGFYGFVGISIGCLILFLILTRQFIKFNKTKED